MTDKKEVILSGIRPTGRLHYGNYFGAIRHFLRLQETDACCYYFIADYHALTTITERQEIYRATLDMLRTYVACGLDPYKSVIYRQSDLPCTAELSLLLGMLTNIGHLERGTTYKDKFTKLQDDPKSEGNPLSYGLLGYPVLMAADILIVRADLVPVGDDQRQHLEMACDIAAKFNHRFGEVLHIPRPLGRDALRLPGLDGSEKMGKSDNNTLDLLDPPKTVLDKIKAVPTTTEPAPLDTDSNDPDIVIGKMPSGVGVLYRLLSLLAPEEVYLDYLDQYRKGGKFYGSLKKTVAEYASQFNAPIIESYNDPAHNDDFIKDFLRENAKRVTPVALETVERCREAMGIGHSLYRA
ncbi:MAG: Tryptophan--tRNA ligase [Candidatus Hydrogenedentes bacterium ADurb.Bin101]|jgi:tryptophanyl-tRNA synthetase|nr:MAG: Tryptophan--tRNA ligase [Candidatus Hydrogenedentes bacterium ADurb.Bin101]HOC68177.1 tryptophan--tRNA ligase [Candidatus Hydrogenedentota bacterium]